jgi:hypothetical protein
MMMDRDFSPHPNPPPLAEEGVRIASCQFRSLYSLPRLRGRVRAGVLHA